MELILKDLRATILIGLLLAALLVFALASIDGYEFQAFFVWLVRWIHVISGIMWVGLLYYFNFVQIPSMGSIPDEQKPAIGKVIAPKALWWFRWSAMTTIVAGLLLAYLNGYLYEAITLQEGVWGIGLGMWIGTIMWFNVWFVIWPNQKKALGIIQVEPDEKASSARIAMLVSRTNTILSIPMLIAMTYQQNPFF